MATGWCRRGVDDHTAGFQEISLYKDESTRFERFDCATCAETNYFNTGVCKSKSTQS